MKKANIITISIIIAIIILSLIILSKDSSKVSKEDAQCIGENSELYTQLGCRACEIQEEMFGENYQYINSIDCFYEREKCNQIEATPTWIIKGEQYKDVQSIEKLKKLTGC